MRGLRYDGAVRLDRNRPPLTPPPGEAVIRPLLAGVCNTDIELAKGYMGFVGVLGHEFVGVVEAAPDDPSWVGRRVVGEINAGCGACETCATGDARHCPNRTVLGVLNRDGVFADRFLLPIKNLHPVPAGVSDEAAVFTEPLAAAYEIAERIDLAGKRIALLGDGKLGSLIGMMLAADGADAVVVGRHPERLLPLEHRGLAVAVADDPLEAASFDVVIDATGSASGLTAALALVRPRGTVVMKTTVAAPAPVDINKIVVGEITVVGSRCGPFDRALSALADGRIDPTPLISGIMRLDDGVAALARAGEPGVLKILLAV